MKILFFGKLAELTASNSLEIAGVKDAEELRTNLFKTYPALKTEEFQLAVNGTRVSGNIVLQEKDEIALLPAFAGG